MDKNWANDELKEGIMFSAKDEQMQINDTERQGAEVVAWTWIHRGLVSMSHTSTDGQLIKKCRPTKL